MAKIHDTLKELEEQIEAAATEEVKDEVIEEVKPPEEEKPAVETPKEPEKVEEKTPSDYRRERLEKKAREDELRERAERAERKLAEQEAAKSQSSDPEPDPEDEVAHAKWEIRQTKREMAELKQQFQQTAQKIQREEVVNGAQQEFNVLEAQTRQKYNDFGEVAQDFMVKTAREILLENPDLDQATLAKKTNNAILEKASKLYNAGYSNPVEVLYLHHKENGYRAPAKVEVKEEVKPNLTDIKRNKERSSGMTAANGSGKAEMTMEYMANLKPKEVAKLSKEDREKYFARNR
jgi:hypothetical protein